jgi:putative peptide zinc metalloprotease protein
MSSSERSQQTPEHEVRSVPTKPKLASDVELVGEFEGTGFAERQWLVRRGDRFIQLTELLYQIAEKADGERDLDEIAAAVTDATEWIVTEDNVRELIGSRLVPLGVIDGNGAVTHERRRGPEPVQALALRMRVRVLGPRAIEPIARALQYFFAPPVVVAALALAAVGHYWMYRVHGLIGAFLDALYMPSSLLVILAVTLAAAVVHEFGHASALRYGGGRARGMGFGLYLVFPAFYTDVTEGYRLGRWARVRTGLGGPYFHLLFALALIGAAYAFGYGFLLLAVLLINIEIIRQFIPFVRLDGYWVLADLTGVPDFFSQIGPFLRSLSPRLARGIRLPRLKRWVQVVFLTYIVVTIPLLAALVVLIVKFLPRVMTMMWDAVVTQVSFLRDAAAAGDSIGVATAAVQLAILMLPVLGLALLLYTLTWKPLRSAWTQPTPRRRALALAVVATVLGVVGFLWYPQLPSSANAAPAGVETFDVDARTHTTAPVAYPQSPPVGGRHAPIWQNCGFYAAPIPDENGVHSIEHGAVWITYQPGLPGSQLDRLRALAREEYVLVSPYPGLTTSVVASSWGRQLRVASAQDARLPRFVGAFRLSSEAPEAGGPCTGGRGTPR